MTDEQIVKGLSTFDAGITKKYFYGYCRRAYHIFDHKYQLRNKTGLDFYSLAHDYYISLLSHDFRPLLDKPESNKLSSWMIQGFFYKVQDALKEYNKEFSNLSDVASDVVLDFVRSSDTEEGMMFQVAEAVASHYCDDRKMQEIAHMIFYAGYKQKDVAAQLGMTASAVNQRYKKMMNEVVTPYVIENYGQGIYLGAMTEISYSIACESTAMSDAGLISPAVLSMKRMLTSNMWFMVKRTTPERVTSLKRNEIFVFGSNLLGIHAGGAARMARLRFGAVTGQGEGLQGQSYAIPTMQGGIETIVQYVDKFIDFAKEHKDKTFLVTPIGCGIAGFEPEDIAPLFGRAIQVDNIHLPKSFWEILQ